MLEGTPCSLITSLKYNWVNFSNENLTLIGKKCTDFVSLSTITQMESKPLGVLGKPTTKSIEMLSVTY